ncbi:MAG: ABC transporter ATP-binding protein [Candidatus Bathyarchaeum sp.]|nr:MAG: ABC transporter ATP-binding protein [Candidatus Bathyarchaeum sp.]
MFWFSRSSRGDENGMSEPMIQTQQLTKQYKDVLAVDQLDITVNTGEIVGFLGPNGSGKTTTLLMLMGLSLPTSGTATVDGNNVVTHSKEVRKIAAMLPEGAGYYGDLTARQNLRYIGELNEKSGPELEKRIDELLEAVNLTRWADSKVNTFSRGMKQRLGITEVLVKDPKVAFFDEPTLGLDPKSTKELRDILIKLNTEENLTILLSSHLLYEIQQTCQKVLILRKGKLVVSDSIENLSNHFGSTERTSIEFELTKVTSELITKLKDVEGVTSVDKDNNRLYVHTETDKSRELSETITKSGSTILLMKPKEHSLEEIFLQYYEED